MNSHNIRSQKIDRLTQHAGFGFNSADSPAQYTKPVNHRRVRVRAHKGVRIVKPVFLPDDLRQVFEIYLMANPDSRRDDIEAFVCLCPPLQKLISGAVSLKLHFHIALESIGTS